MGTCETNVTVCCREVLVVWRCHLLSHCILDENIYLCFGSVRCIELSVNGCSTVCLFFSTHVN